MAIQSTAISRTGLKPSYVDWTEYSGPKGLAGITGLNDNFKR